MVARMYSTPTGDALRRQLHARRPRRRRADHRRRHGRDGGLVLARAGAGVLRSRAEPRRVRQLRPFARPGHRRARRVGPPRRARRRRRRPVPDARGAGAAGRVGVREPRLRRRTPSSISCPRSPASPSTPSTAASASIAAVVERFNPQVESMEGAAFMSACLIHQVPFAQVRAVSNVVERRNREAWKMAEAIRNLDATALRILNQRMTLTLGFSPCPNDCFMFDAIVNRRIDLEGLEFDAAPGRRRGAEQGGVRRRGRRHQAELSRLRLLHRRLRAARRRQRARTQLRTAADLEARDRAGRGRGGQAAHRDPRAVTRPRTSCSAWRFPKAQDKTPLVFSEIEAALLDGRFDAGLIIHENRFTYEAKGLKKIIDLGEFWEARPARRFRSAASSSGARCRTR